MGNYKLNESKMFADVTDGIAIVINSETGIYYGLNAFGTNVYENIEKGVSTEKILAKIKELGAPDSIDEAFKTFIDSMLEKELLEETEDSGLEAEIDAEVAKNDNYVLEFKEYNDAQELLLADPIHEVKEETGWTGEKDSIGYSKEETKEREKKTEE